MLDKNEWDRRKAAQNAIHEKKVSDAFIAKMKDPITFFTAALFIASVLQFCALHNTDEKIGKQVVLLRDQLTLAYPAKLQVGNVAIWPVGKAPTSPVDFSAKCGQKACEFEGEIWFNNLGGEEIEVDPNSRCIVFWTDGGQLPMIRPYLTTDQKDDPRNCSKFLRAWDFKEIPGIMKPGDIARATFKTTVPSGYDESIHHLYVMGTLVYTDRLTRRPNIFARRYDPEKRRFIAEQNNPDYESP